MGAPFVVYGKDYFFALIVSDPRKNLAKRPSPRVKHFGLFVPIFYRRSLLG